MLGVGLRKKAETDLTFTVTAYSSLGTIDIPLFDDAFDVSTDLNIPATDSVTITVMPLPAPALADPPPPMTRRPRGTSQSFGDLTPATRPRAAIGPPPAPPMRPSGEHTPRSRTPRPVRDLPGLVARSGSITAAAASKGDKPKES